MIHFDFICFDVQKLNIKYRTTDCIAPWDWILYTQKTEYNGPIPDQFEDILAEISPQLDLPS